MTFVTIKIGPCNFDGLFLTLCISLFIHKLLLLTNLHHAKIYSLF
jgi:hypothetical protein